MAIGEGRLLFTRHLTEVSGRELKKYLGKEMDLPEDVADALARLLVGEPVLQPTLAPLLEKAEAKLVGYFTRFAIEIQSSIDAFAITFRRQKIDQLFLCGGGATLRGLKEYLSENLAIQARVLDPSIKFGVQADSPHLYSIAAGLAQYTL